MQRQTRTDSFARRETEVKSAKWMKMTSYAQLRQPSQPIADFVLPQTATIPYRAKFGKEQAANNKRQTDIH